MTKKRQFDNKTGLPSQTLLLTMFRYDKARGVLRRFNSKVKCGRKVSIMNVDYWSARVAWKMVTGREPMDVIEFKDGDADNLRWNNLVELTHAEHRLLGENAHATSETGERGVYITRSGRYRAEFRLGAKKHVVGTFRTVKEARRARRLAIRQRLTTPNQ